ncbi:Uncharacterized membrane protein [Curtobacterium sp. 314Chir4.1]|uniref:DUF1269 domain-containing protein n=1 Tax=Curtobacterium sp. 314Chir4.1 TaxID=1279028 RepID=UPI000BCF4F69|nr:DUF1269 domain-containing protein [Curtobacterium sp. 314Chir4.1]SOC86904.1 Uncharacterized membrane protein [Curtobacterium sp. 314Chir4.1]
MSDLIVISFDDEAKATAAYEEVQQLQDDLIVELAGLALVRVDDYGKKHVETPGPVGKVGAGAGAGALFGTMMGLLFFVPFFGLVIGGALGALFAGLDKTGLNAEFRDRVKTAVADGRSAVVIYATKITEDKFGEALRGFGGTIVQTSLSDADEHELAHDMTAAR